MSHRPGSDMYLREVLTSKALPETLRAELNDTALGSGVTDHHLRSSISDTGLRWCMRCQDHCHRPWREAATQIAHGVSH